MSKTNIKCPRCNSDKLYNFGLNKQANQKYQCKQCKRQFALGDGDGLPKLNLISLINLKKTSLLQTCLPCNKLLKPI